MSDFNWPFTIEKNISKLFYQIDFKDSSFTCNPSNKSQHIRAYVHSISPKIETPEILIKTYIPGFNFKDADLFYSISFVDSSFDNYIANIFFLHEEIKKGLFRLPEPSFKNLDIIPCFTIRAKPGSPGYNFSFTTKKIILEKGHLVKDGRLESKLKDLERFDDDELLFIKSHKCEWLEGMYPEKPTCHGWNQVTFFNPSIRTLEDFITLNLKGTFNGKTLKFIDTTDASLKVLLDVL